MLEPEAAYAHLDDMMALGEGLVAVIGQGAVKNRAADLEALKRDVKALEKIAPPFPRNYLRGSDSNFAEGGESGEVRR